MVSKNELKQFHKISVISLLAVVIGIITFVPAMADKDSSDDHNRVDICHFDKEDGKFIKLSVPEDKAKGHAKNHGNDVIPAPADGCTEQAESESETDSDDSVSMDEFMEDLTRHEQVITEITNSKCSLGEVVAGFGPNGELICSQDKTGETNSFNIISRFDTIELQSGASLLKEYFCEPREIMMGGLIETSSVETPLIINGVLVNNSVQSYVVAINKNNNPETVTVNITYLCFDII